MSHPDPRVFLLLFSGPAAVSWGMSQLKERRRIENTPRSKIRSAAMGMVSLSGLSRQRAQVIDPIDKVPCCWWRCVVEEYRSSGKSSYWATLKEAMSEESFYLEDDTGKLMVDPHGAEIFGDETTIPLDSSTRAVLEPALNSWGVEDKGCLWGLKTLRIRKRVIPPDFPLFIYGELAHRQDGAEDRQRRFLETIREIQEDPKRMAESGALKDGNLDYQAWEAFCRKQREAFQQEDAAGQAQAPECDKLVVRKSDAEGMVVDTKSEEALLGCLERNSFFGVCGGIALSGLAVWVALAEGFSYEVTGGAAAVGLAIGMFFGSAIRPKV